MNKKTIWIIVAVVVVALIGWYLYQNNMSSQAAMSDDSMFASDAAAILASPATSQMKIDQLNARLAAKRARAAKVGGSYKAPAITR